MTLFYFNFYITPQNNYSTKQGAPESRLGGRSGVIGCSRNALRYRDLQDLGKVEQGSETKRGDFDETFTRLNIRKPVEISM
jgi:hypothetical protein